MSIERNVVYAAGNAFMSIQNKFVVVLTTRHFDY